MQIIVLHATTEHSYTREKVNIKELNKCKSALFSERMNLIIRPIFLHFFAA